MCPAQWNCPASRARGPGAAAKRGAAGATFTTAPNSGAIFTVLEPFEERAKDPLIEACAHLAKQRPTAINLRWALEEMRAAVRNQPRQARVAAAYARAAEMVKLIPQVGLPVRLLPKRLRTT